MRFIEMNISYLLVFNNYSRYSAYDLLCHLNHSLNSLIRFHDDADIRVYCQGISDKYTEYLVEKFGAEIREIKNNYDYDGLGISSIHLHKIDILREDTLYLDIDTEIIRPLHPIYESNRCWMSHRERLLEDYDCLSDLDKRDWSRYGLKNPVSKNYYMWGSGLMYVPLKYKFILDKVYELAKFCRSALSDDCRWVFLTEQLAFSLSFAMHDLTLVESQDFVKHFWPEKYWGRKWYNEIDI
jgi:hypothetical protein